MSAVVRRRARLSFSPRALSRLALLCRDERPVPSGCGAPFSRWRRVSPVKVPWEAGSFGVRMWPSGRTGLAAQAATARSRVLARAPRPAPRTIQHQHRPPHPDDLEHCLDRQVGRQHRSRAGCLNTHRPRRSSTPPADAFPAPSSNQAEVSLTAPRGSRRERSMGDRMPQDLRRSMAAADAQPWLAELADNEFRLAGVAPLRHLIRRLLNSCHSSSLSVMCSIVSVISPAPPPGILTACQARTPTHCSSDIPSPV